MRNCKNRIRIFFAAVLFLLTSGLYAYSGKMTGEKNIRIIKTEWFDIIYPERCQATAAIFYENADRVYGEVTAEYGLTPRFRMPLVIVPAVENFNAFWTAVPYNHIVLYDTSFSGASELAVFSETMLSVFRHELTHAVTYNMKNGFFFAIDKVLGDYFVPGMATVTTGMAEGATVAYESSMGEGRLNDEYAKHYVKQAKIEGKFPSYHDVSGSSDVTPGGAPYYFNGAFHKWLQDKYGLEPYAEFWYSVVNLKHFTIQKCFRKAFGVKLKAAWKEFVAEYEVPDLATDPVKAGNAEPLIKSEGNLFTLLSAGGNKIVWADNYGRRVFYADLAEGQNSLPLKAHFLFALDNLSNVGISVDGRFITATYMSGNSAFERSRVKIYDMENGSMFSVKETGLKEAAVIPGNGGYYLIGQKYENSTYSISLSKIVMKEGRGAKAGSDLDSGAGRIDHLEPLYCLPQKAEVNPFYFTTYKDGTFTFIKKAGLDYSICTCNLDGSVCEEFFFPKDRRISVRSLSASAGDTVLYFSYAEPGTMPRLGKLDTESGIIYLGKTDLSGGIFSPVKYKDTALYIGKFYRQNKVLALKSLEQFEEVEVDRDFAAAGMDFADADSSLPSPSLSSSTQSSLASEKFNPLPYLARGMLLPLSQYESDYFGRNAGYKLSANQFPFGLTYITGAPWTDGAASLYQVTAGWNLLSNSVGAALTIKNGTDSGFFTYNLTVKSEFDPKGWKQSGGNLDLGLSFTIGNISNIKISNSAGAYCGRQDARLQSLTLLDPYMFWVPGNIGKAISKDDSVYYELIDTVKLQYSNITRVGQGRYEYAGFALSLALSGRYDSMFNAPQTVYVKSANLAAGLKIRLPRLLPFSSKTGFTWNLPVTLDYILLPSSSIYGYACRDTYRGMPFFDGRVETVLFGVDVQKAIPFLEALFVNDLYISAGYACTGDAAHVVKSGFQPFNLGTYYSSLFDGKGFYYDSVYLKTGIEFTPNIGLFAKSSAKMNLFAAYVFILHGEYNKPLRFENRWKIQYGFEANF